MRFQVSVLLIVLTLALAVCAYLARYSGRRIGRSLFLLLTGLIPPVIGNLIIIFSESRRFSIIGAYIYYLGMDFVIYALLRFSFDYCDMRWSRRVSLPVTGVLMLDILQLLCNPFFGHAFALEEILVDGRPYFQLIPFFGQSFHRIVVYGVFIATLIIFLFRILHTPRIYAEHYWVIFLTMVFTGLWQSFYIFSGTPIDRSMIGFGFFGLLVYYFAIHYRPVRLLDRMLAALASELPEALFFFDASGRCVWANSQGISLADIRGGNYDVAVERLTDLFQIRLSDSFGNGEDEWALQKDARMGSELRSYFLERHSVNDFHGHPVGSFLSVRDNTAEQKKFRKELFEATHDSLTGLYSSDYLLSRIPDLMAQNPGERFLLLYSDVDSFKVVNDIFGTAFGDYVLQCIADFLRAELPEQSLISRVSGDKFDAFVPASRFDREGLERRLSDFVVSNGRVEHRIQLQIGAYEIEDANLNVSVMLDRARLALTTIKANYQLHIAFYDEQMRQKVLWNQHICSELAHALSEGQICPYLQPIVDSSGTVIGAEALVRWIHPVDGILSPARFVPVFEENGMIADLDRYMWRSVCRLLSGWKETHPDFFLSINISPMDFYFVDVVSELRGLIGEYAIEPSRLRVEITETVMMTDVEKRFQILSELRADGIVVELDDFGSGYSSFNVLKDMPVDVLKLDMKFLTQSVHPERAETILRSIFRLSKDLGLLSLAEGVETESQLRLLSDMKCNMFQGYYFDKPLPVETFEERLFC